jgi:Gpi18-like mannosyltransferase
MTLLKKFSIMAFITWTMIATILRAWRNPNDFAEAHWLLNYDFGFVKRALPGEILSLIATIFSRPITAELIACVAMVISLIFYLILLYISWRILARSQWSSSAILIIIVFACSPFMVMSAHINGYYDSIVILLGVCALYLIQKQKIWLAAFLLGLSLLVHENAILLIFPVFCLSWLLIREQQQQTNQRPLPFVPLLIPPLVFMLIMLGMTALENKAFVGLFTEKLTAYSFIAEDRNTLVPDWIIGGMDESLRPHMGETLLYLGSMTNQHLITPTVLVILFFVAASFGKASGNKALLMLIGVCLAPQLMHLVAWDTHRIWTYSMVTSFLALWVYSENKTIIHHQHSINVIYLVAILLNVLMITPLMDGEYDQLYDLDKRLLYFGPVIIGSLLLTANRHHKK